MSHRRNGFQVEPLEPRTLFAAALGLPRPDHVVVVVEENHSHAAITSSADAPYINALAADGASFTDYHAVTHPSQPNYLALFSGSTQGVKDDLPVWSVPGPSLGGQLHAAGLSFTGYSEDLPYTGFPWLSHRYYSRRHNPWVNFSDVPWTDNQPLRNFPSPGHYDRLPTVSFVIPNVVNDMHDGTVRQADDWLRTKLDPYVQWAKAHNSLLVVTWDEDEMQVENRIPTIIGGAGVKPGNYSTPLTHYSLLRTIEDMYGLSPLGQAAAATPILDAWQPPAEKTTHVAPMADAFVFDDAPTTNFGKSAGLDVKTSKTAGQNRDAYFKFDVAGLNATDIASVRLRFFGGLSSTDRVAAGVFSVADNTWGEDAIAWANRPPLGKSLGATVLAATSPGWYEVDVTDYVRQQRSAGRSTVSLALHNPFVSSARFHLNSREAKADRPELLVVAN